jgi:hypothetical protein
MASSGVSRVNSSDTSTTATGTDGKSQARRQFRSKQVVDQDAAVLRVILELHHVVVFVRAAHQVRTRASPHPPYLFQRP